MKGKKNIPQTLTEVTGKEKVLFDKIIDKHYLKFCKFIDVVNSIEEDNDIECIGIDCAGEDEDSISFMIHGIDAEHKIELIESKVYNTDEFISVIKESTDNSDELLLKLSMKVSEESLGYTIHGDQRKFIK